MALLQYFKLKKERQHLPNPNGPLSVKVPSSGIAAANLHVSKLLDKTNPSVSNGEAGTQGPYTVLTPAQKYEIGKKAAEMGTMSAMRYYDKNYLDLAKKLKETSVQRFKDMYNDEVKNSIHSSTCESPSLVKELVPKKRGRPLLIGEELDGQVKEYIKELRRLGVVINSDVVIAVGTGIVMKNDANLLFSNGGYLDLTKHWAKYLLSRMGFVKRRANTKAKITVEHFDELKKLYLLEFNNVVEMDEIPSELVINWDQTGINYIPVGSWTMAEEGSKRVEMIGKDDMRQLTALFACTMSGNFLPIQLVYQGKTDRSLPTFEFPSDWDVTCTTNHWCNECTMRRYIQRIILPYLDQKRKELKLSAEQPAVLILDNFKGQCTAELFKLLDSNNINVILIPANCTDRLQPLDINVNKAAKEFLRKQFHQWYAKQVCAQLQQKCKKEPLDLQASVVKSLGAQWMVEMYNYFKKKPDIIHNRFAAAGLLK